MQVITVEKEMETLLWNVQIITWLWPGKADLHLLSVQGLWELSNKTPVLQ